MTSYSPTIRRSQKTIRETGSRWFDINAYTVGYTRDIGILQNVETGLGANMLYGVTGVD